VVDRRLLERMTTTPANTIARAVRTTNDARVSPASVGEPQVNPGHVDWASAAWIARSSDAASSSMIDATVAKSDPVPSRAMPVFRRSELPPRRSGAASYELRGASPEPGGVSPCLAGPPDAVGSSPGEVGVVPGGDVGVGFGAGEDVWVGDVVGSGLGDGDGSREGEGSGVGDVVGEGFGGFVGFGGFEGFGSLSAETCLVRRISSTEGSVFAAIADDTALRVRATVRRATALAWRIRLLRSPLELPPT
jgi:hypothetical protein